MHSLLIYISRSARRRFTICSGDWSQLENATLLYHQYLKTRLCSGIQMSLDPRQYNQEGSQSTIKIN